MLKNKDHQMHVFVDDYERRVERDFSRQVFGRTEPIKVMKRPIKDRVKPNEQAHFVFNETDCTFLGKSALCPFRQVLIDKEPLKLSNRLD
jgi:hypothetical protein